MPSVAPPAKVLVTGANGFIAVHVSRELLEKGYEVIGTVRSKDKGEYLEKTLKPYGGKFSYVIVEDIEKEDAFDEAVKGVDAIEHTASPFHFGAKTVDELVQPAIKGTVGILKSAAKYGPSVQRVVITSSYASIGSPKDTHPYTYTEKDWNDASPAAIKEKGADAGPGQIYSASKSLAEREAWKFIEENKGQIKFDLATINPSYIFGPILHDVKDIKSLNQSIAIFYDRYTNQPDKEETQQLQGGYVDVRDVAKAHVLALGSDKAAGERFLLTARTFTVQDIYDAGNKAGVKNTPKGYSDDFDRSKFDIQDGSKVTRVLGLQYLSAEETVADTIGAIRERFPDAQ